MPEISLNVNEKDFIPPNVLDALLAAAQDVENTAKTNQNTQHP